MCHFEGNTKTETQDTKLDPCTRYKAAQQTSQSQKTMGKR